MKIEMGEWFDSVDKRLGSIDEKLDGIGGQFEHLTEQRIEVSEDVSYTMDKGHHIERDVFKLKRI
jgi:archaellum component FlaC